MVFNPDPSKQAQDVIFSWKQKTLFILHYFSVTMTFPRQHFNNIWALYLTYDLHLKDV